MLSLLGGIGVFGASAGVFWALRPHDGQPHPAVEMPLLGTSIPLTITVGVVMGIAMIISGIASFT